MPDFKKKAKARKNQPRKLVTIWNQDLDVKYVGRLPYRWKIRKAFQDLWNPHEPRLFPPKQFGIGWSLNLYVLWNAYQKIKKQLDRE